ncbi:hypothetical protein [Acidovorax sp.]|uniref:hypothetical protein n=1 Tax=Acidovorax sp. TaxID=1872122 RepID=UPI0026203DB6|nr:hypothetical protein [Acidovorax sp.]
MRIDAFPKGKDIWRIDWYGPIAFPDRMARRRQPSVLVYLSKVVAPSPLENPSALLQPNCTLPASQQAKRWVSVGTTLLLRIGDLWQNQTLVARPSYEQAVFEDVTINWELTSLVKAGLSSDAGSFLLPLAHHPWHLNNTHSYCVRVALPDDRVLVVPCMELVRFYFGSSSELISRLFAPPLSRSKLHHRSFLTPKGYMSLELAERIPRASAEDVARIAGCDAAWRAAALVSSSCLKSSVAGRDIYPQAIFPFEGTTTLQASGLWLPHGDVENGTFLAYQLHSCYHPFPFRTLRVKLHQNTPPKPPAYRPNLEQPEKPAEPVVRKKAAEPVPAEPQTLQEHDASSTLAPTLRTQASTRRFPDLDGKSIHTERLLHKDAQPQPSTSPALVSELAVGQPGSARRIRPVSLVEIRTGSRKPALPTFLRYAVGAMESMPTLEVQVLTASDEDGWTVPVSLLADEDGVINDGFFFSENGKPRRIALFLISSGSMKALLTVMEGHELFPEFQPLSEIEAADPSRLLLDRLEELARPRSEPPFRRWRVAPTLNDAQKRIARWLAYKFQSPDTAT